MTDKANYSLRRFLFACPTLCNIFLLILLTRFFSVSTRAYDSFSYSFSFSSDAHIRLSVPLPKYSLTLFLECVLTHSRTYVVFPLFLCRFCGIHISIVFLVSLLDRGLATSRGINYAAQTQAAQVLILLEHDASWLLFSHSDMSLSGIRRRHSRSCSRWVVNGEKMTSAGIIVKVI